MDKVSYMVVKDYLEILQREYFTIDGFYLGLGEHKKVQLSNDIFAIEQVYETKEKTLCNFEAHKKYVDIHYILDGTETIAISNTKELDVIKEYDHEGDYSLYGQPLESSSLFLVSGDIAVFFPHDAHMACVMTLNNTRVIKTVVKIPVEHWKYQGVHT